MLKMKCCGGSCCCKPSVAKRGAISLTLGLGFGVLCAFLASRSSPGIFSFSSPMLWVIVFNRFLIGYVIFLAGWMTIHPIFKFRLPAYLRGFCIGAIVSIGLGLGVFLNPIPGAMNIFWMTILVGGFYGLVIDMIASHCGAKGKDLLA